MIERPEHSRLVLPEDSHLKCLAAGFAAIQQQKPMFSTLQIDALKLRAGLIQFLNEIGSMPQSGIDSKSRMGVEDMVRYAEYKRDVEEPWIARVRSNYVLRFKAEAERIYNLFVVNEIIDQDLKHLAQTAYSPQTIQDLADALWKVAGQVKT